MITKVQAIRTMIGGYFPRNNPEWIDAYNKQAYPNVSGTILTGINYRNMHFVAVIVDV